MRENTPEYKECVNQQFNRSIECQQNRDSLKCKNSLEQLEIKNPNDWCKRETVSEFYNQHPLLFILSLPILATIGLITYLITGD